MNLTNFTLTEITIEVLCYTHTQNSSTSSPALSLSGLLLLQKEKKKKKHERFTFLKEQVVARISCSYNPLSLDPPL